MKKNESGAGVIPVTKSKYETPENFFPIVVDNFFDDPEAIVEYGKSLPKEKVGLQPGMRSHHLWEIDEILHNTILKKILNCYYDLDYVNLTWKLSNMNFHEISRFSEDKNDIRNNGWIHQDVDVFGNDEVAGLIYLTPDIDPDSGTSLWSLKPNAIIKSKEQTKQEGWIEHRKKFTEKLRFQNIFNRLIMYDTCEWHGANSYYNYDGKDARLTLAFFIGGIEGREYPLKRIKNSKYESIIKNQIEKNE